MKKICKRNSKYNRIQSSQSGDSRTKRKSLV